MGEEVETSFAKNVPEFNEYNVLIQFLKHNQSIFTKGLKNGGCQDNNIFMEMEKYFILPLLRDAFYWIFEFLRNLFHFGFMEFLYITAFWLYLNTYDTYRMSFYAIPLMGTPLISDFFIYAPFLIAHTIHTYSDKYSTFGCITVYALLFYGIVYFPRVLMITIKLLRRTICPEKDLSDKYGDIMYGLASIFAIIYGIAFAAIFYSGNNPNILSTVGENGTTDLYLRECISGLICFSIVRAIFLYSEILLDKAPLEEKNLIKSAEKVKKLKNRLFLKMVYVSLILGSVGFFYTYYSFKTAALDTSIARDINCINVVASHALRDPLQTVLDIAFHSLKKLSDVAKDSWIDVSKFINKIVDGVSDLFEDHGESEPSFFYKILHSFFINYNPLAEATR